MNEINKTIISHSLQTADNHEIMEIFEKMPYMEMMRIHAILNSRIEYGEWGNENA